MGILFVIGLAIITLLCLAVDERMWFVPQGRTSNKVSPQAELIERDQKPHLRHK